MQSYSKSLEELKISVSCITPQDYIKFINTEKEFLQVVELMIDVFPDYWEDLEEEGLERAALAKDNYILGYFTDKNKLLGSVRLRKIRQYNVLTFFALQVDLDYRNRKIATNLFNTVKKIAHRINISYILLNVDASNIRAIRLYENWNFEKMPRVASVSNKNRFNSEKIDLEKKYPIKALVNEESYHIALNFFSIYYPEYLEIFRYQSVIKKMVEEQRIYALFNKGNCELLVTETKKKNQLDIYIPILNKKTKKFIANILNTDLLELNSYESILFFGDITFGGLKSLKHMGITLDRNKTGYSYYYRL